MLKLRDIVNVENIKNESDFYIRIKILFGNYFSQVHPIYYWSTSGIKKTHLEIGIGQKFGDIYDITVVSMPSNIVNKQLSISDHVLERVGLPSLLLDTKYYKCSNLVCYSDEYSTRESIDFEVYVDDISVSIVLLNNEVTLKIINGPIVFGFDKDDILCFIQMNGMKLNSEGFLEKIV